MFDVSWNDHVHSQISALQRALYRLCTQALIYHLESHPYSNNVEETLSEYLPAIMILSFVKLKSQVQTSVLGLLVDFVLPLSQQEQEQREQQEKEPTPKSI